MEMALRQNLIILTANRRSPKAQTFLTILNREHGNIE